MAALTFVQGGHDVSYKLSSGEVRYTFKGVMLSSYTGGISAPASRKSLFDGVYKLRTENRAGKWVVLGLTDGLSVLAEKGKALSPADKKLATKGTWLQVVGGEASYLLNGKPILPSQLSAPLWPFAWVPLTSKEPTKIDDVLIVNFSFPLQTFLEDDPIGRLAVPLRFVFNGPSYPSSSGLYSFSLKTDQAINQAVKHPEDSTLRLTGRVLIDARLKIRKDDGRLESGDMIMSVDLALQGPKYPFGFSKAKGSVTATMDRIK